jgi:dihydroneopterin aldolase
MDEISLQGLTFFGRHGVNPEETSLGQRFGVDVTLWLDLASAAATDRIEDTVSYSAIFKIVRAEVEGEPSKLLEHLAGRLLKRIAAQDTRISKVRVTVTKLNPPLGGSVTGSVSVTLMRDLQGERAQSG